MVVALYQSPIQSHDEFSNFVTNFESILEARTLKKPFLTKVLGDFNAKKNPGLIRTILHMKDQFCMT